MISVLVLLYFVEELQKIELAKYLLLYRLQEKTFLKYCLKCNVRDVELPIWFLQIVFFFQILCRRENVFVVRIIIFCVFVLGGGCFRNTCHEDTSNHFKETNHSENLI